MMPNSKTLVKRKPFYRRSTFQIMMSIFVIAFILRLGLVLRLPDNVFWSDEKDNIALSERVVEGKGYVNDNGLPTAYRAVGYPALLVVLRYVGIKSLLTIRIFQIFLSLATIWLVFRFSSELFNVRIGLLSALISALYPYYIFLPGTILSTTWLCFLILLSTYLFYKATASNKLYLFVLSAMVYGLAVLTHPTALVLVGAVSLWYFRALWPDNKRNLKTLAIFLFIFAAIVSPWYYRNYTKLHVMNLVTNGGRNLWLGNNPSATIQTGSNIDRPDSLDRVIMETDSEVERDKIYLQEAEKFIRENPGRFIRLTIQKGLAFWRPDPSPTTPGYVEIGLLLRLVSILTFGPLFLLALMTLLYAAPPFKRFISLLVYYGLFYTFLHAVFITKVRFRLPLDYFVIMLASFAFVTLITYLQTHSFRELMTGIVRFKLQLSPSSATVEMSDLKDWIKNLHLRLLFFLHDRKKLLLAILIAALFVRVIFVLMLDPNGFYFSDTRHYDAAARSVLAGSGFGEKYYRTPLYPVLMAGIYWLFGKSFLAMRLFEAVLSTLLCALAYVLGKRIVNPTIGLIMAALFAFYPHFILLPGILYSTNVFTLLLALSVLSLLKTDAVGSPLFALVAGLTAGLAALTVPAVFFVLPLWLVWISLRPVTTSFNRIALVACFLLGFIFVLSPWTIRNYHKYGQLIFVQPLPNKVLPDLADTSAQNEKIGNGFKDVADYLREHPHGTKDDNLFNTVRHYLRNPGGAVRYAARELLHYWALYPDRLNTQDPQFRAKIHAEDPRMIVRGHQVWSLVKVVSIVIMTPVFLLALFGLSQVNLLKREIILLLIIIISMSLGYSLIYAEVRYRIPVEPYVLLFTAMGIHGIFKRQIDKK